MLGDIKMNLFIALFFVLCIQFPANAAKTTPATETILVQEGDIVQYPLNAEPIEVEAKLNGLWYICTLMPWDFFEAVEIINYPDGKRSKIRFIKREGTPGNQETCFAYSSINIMGTQEMRKSKDGVPQRVSTVRIPFVFNSKYLQDIQKRKMLPTTLSAGETILFKIGDIIEYPLDADFIEVESNMDRLDFKCTEAPGDSFEVIEISNLSEGENIIVKKREGTSGNHEICPKDSFTFFKITNCVLKRTEEGIPEGLLCNHSLQTLFNPQ